LALVGSMTLDDPEGWRLYKQITEAVVPIRPYTSSRICRRWQRRSHAFQRLSNVVVQKSISEGFGLVVSETLWKETPLSQAAPAAFHCSWRTAAEHPGRHDRAVRRRRVTPAFETGPLAKELGQRGRELVRQQFLIPRLVLNELTLLDELAHGSTPASPRA